MKVSQHEPRISIVSSTPKDGAAPPPPPEDRKPIPALALDALAERVEAEGPRARGFHTARGLSNDEIETKVVADAGGSPVISASAILSRFRSQDPVVPARRLEVLAAEIDRLVTEEPVGTSLKVTALAPDVAPARAPVGAPTLRLERTDTGLLLHGVESGAGEAATGPSYRWAGRRRDRPWASRSGPPRCSSIGSSSSGPRARTSGSRSYESPRGRWSRCR